MGHEATEQGTGRAIVAENCDTAVAAEGCAHTSGNQVTHGLFVVDKVAP